MYSSSKKKNYLFQQVPTQILEELRNLTLVQRYRLNMDKKQQGRFWNPALKSHFTWYTSLVSCQDMHPAAPLSCVPQSSLDSRFTDQQLVLDVVLISGLERPSPASSPDPKHPPEVLLVSPSLPFFILHLTSFCNHCVRCCATKEGPVLWKPCCVTDSGNFF